MAGEPGGYRGHRLPSPPPGRKRPKRTASIAAVAVIAAATAFSLRSFLPAQAAHAQAGHVTAIVRPPQHITTSPATVPSLAGLAGRPDLAIGARRSPPRRRVRKPVYRNPLRAITGLVLERVDMGADFAGSGPVYAIGKAIITSAAGDNEGWPGGGWITYEVTAGRARGLQVYVAEDVTPAVQAGEQVTSHTVIGRMYDGGDGIETGWAMPDGQSAESQLPIAGGVSGEGPFPTEVGLNFDRLLQSLGVPPAPNSHQAGHGMLPSFYPPNWSAVRLRK